MSDYRIALVAEGKTDAIVIEAGLKAILRDRAFILTQLQPEATLPHMGTGWCGVFKWCRQLNSRHEGPLEADALLSYFDLLILHVDADVARATSTDCGGHVKDLLWDVPCAEPCPPADPTVQALERVVSGWLGSVTLGSKGILCIPAQCTGTWLAAAVLPPEHTLLRTVECTPSIESALERLPLRVRIRKTKRDSRTHAGVVTQRWAQVAALCTQAARFEDKVRRHFASNPDV